MFARARFTGFFKPFREGFFILPGQILTGPMKLIASNPRNDFLAGGDSFMA